jgi:hypothetical protein
MSRTYRLFKLSLFTSLVFAGLYPATALAVPVCGTATLDTYTNPTFDREGGCTIGDFTFFRFTAPTPTTIGSPTVASESQILVTPVLIDNGAGLSFSAMSDGVNLFSVTSPAGTTAVTYFIDYSVDPAPVIGGADLRIDPPAGDASATQIYCTSDVLSTCSVGNESQQTVTNPSPLVSTITFSNPSQFVDIQTEINLSATPGDPASLDSVTADVTTVSTTTPEPAAYLLTSAPLLLLFLARRKRA